MTTANLRIDLGRLMARITALGRDLVVGWMRDLGLRVTIDRIGNVVGLRPGRRGGPPVMTGSHIDTVRTGGLYDGNLGVLAGLEVVECLNEAGLETERPLAVAFFTNEEGARFAPDMMGSMVHQGHFDLDEMLAVAGIDGATLGEELARIGYAGEAACGEARAAAFFELHVEQGPLLEREGVTIGAVTGVQGISWTEVTIEGVSNHAGTTPMALRHDCGYAAGAVAYFVRGLAREIGGHQVGTVGALELTPNLVNVIPNKAVLTVDLRNTEEGLLQEAERCLFVFLDELAEAEGVTVSRRALARFEPVAFDPAMIDLVEGEARALGHGVRRMPSGAGHDAQSFAPNCPTAMIFVPSARGISHNVEEHTEPRDIEAGANLLLRVMLAAAEQPDF
jgi:N-carbamoyl-L-amino-acid hydrolase